MTNQEKLRVASAIMCKSATPRDEMDPWTTAGLGAIMGSGLYTAAKTGDTGEAILHDILAETAGVPLDLALPGLGRVGAAGAAGLMADKWHNAKTDDRNPLEKIVERLKNPSGKRKMDENKAALLGMIGMVGTSRAAHERDGWAGLRSSLYNAGGLLGGATVGAVAGLPLAIPTAGLSSVGGGLAGMLAGGALSGKHIAKRHNETM